MQGSMSVVKTVKTKMRDYDYDRNKKRDRKEFKKFRQNKKDKRSFESHSDNDE